MTLTEQQVREIQADWKPSDSDLRYIIADERSLVPADCFVVRAMAAELLSRRTAEAAVRDAALEEAANLIFFRRGLSTRPDVQAAAIRALKSKASP